MVKQKTVFNHYVSRVFLKSWLRSTPNGSKNTLLCFLIKRQELRSDYGRSVVFAAEDFLYSIKTSDGIDDSFEQYLKDGEDAWGIFLADITAGKGFKNFQNAALCLFLLVSFAYRTKVHFRMRERMFKFAVPDVRDEDRHFALLELIQDNIEDRVSELLRRKMLLIEFEADSLFTCEAPMFDLKFSKFRKDEAYCAITPRHLLVITSEATAEPMLIRQVAPNNSKLSQFWNEFVIERSRDWVVATNDEVNENILVSNLRPEQVHARKATDQIVIIVDGREESISIADIEAQLDK